MNNLGRGSENNQREKDRIFTRETAGIILVLFAAIALVVLITRDVVFGSVGFAISAFLLGTFGYCSYAVLAALVYAGIVLITGKKPSVSGKIVGLCLLLFVFLVCLVHTITAAAIGIPYNGYGAYLSDCYSAGAFGAEGNPWPAPTGGGAVFGLIVYPVAKLTTSIGGYIIFSLLIVGCAYLIYASRKGTLSLHRRKEKEKTEQERRLIDSAAGDTSSLYDLGYASPQLAQPPQQPQYPEQTVSYVPQAENAANNVDRSKRLYELGEEFDFKSKREMRQDRREEARRAQVQQAPVSPYAEGRSILYPDRGQDGENYSWYNERFGGGSSSPAPKRSSSSSNDAPYSSYTSNRIFDKDSYFNNPNRRAISKEQYSDCFRGPSSYSEGHERTVPRTPPVQPEQQVSPPPAPEKREEPKATNYSDLYADGAESNITYSERPRKIFTDISHSETPREDFYRNDVSSEFTAQPAEPVQPSSDGGQSASDIARRVGFGAADRPEMRRTHDEVNKGGAGVSSVAQESPQSDSILGREENSAVSEERTGIGSAEQSNVSRFERGSAVNSSAGSSQRSERENTERDAAPESTRFSRGEEDRFSRSRAVSEPEEVSSDDQEEESGLRPIADNLESAVNLFDEEDEGPAESAVPEAMEGVRRSGREELARGRERRVEEPAEEVRPKHIYAKYNPPPLDLLNDYASAVMDPEEVEGNKHIIVETLKNLKIDSEVVKVTRGPSVTRYDILVPGHIPLGRVLGCDKELALHLHAKDGVNIQTNYENGSISIEVPNKQRTKVGLRELLLSSDFINSKPGALMFGLGKDIEGRSVCGDIVKMKHLLVSGATGSGKTICLHAMILSLLYKYSPEDLRLIIIDPKQVDFIVYDKLPHLMVNEIFSNDIPKILNVLDWLIREMERRYTIFREKAKRGVPVREIDDYNNHLSADEEKLPKIVMIIDELADLMASAKKEIEDRIQRLTQKSRAAGIHLVLATQRPSVNVITGVIKTNLPTRIALKLTQEVDSRTILDESGAEKLLGNGDMLYRTDSMTFPCRLQGALVIAEEMHRVVSYVKEHNEAYFDDRVSDFINNEQGGAGGAGGDDDSVEPVYIDALRYVVQIKQASISMIQRRCSVGYPKAGKIIEWMENMGYISAFDGAKARKVLLTQEEFDAKYGDDYGE